MNHDESGNRFAVYGKVLDFPEFCLHNWMSNRCGMLKTRCYGVPKVGKVAQELLILCNTECMCVQSNQTTKVQLCQVINVLVFWQEWTLSEQLAYEIKLMGKNWHRSLIKTLFFFLHWAQGEQSATYQHIPAHSSTKGWILFNTETLFLFLHLNKEFTWMLLASTSRLLMSVPRAPSACRLEKSSFRTTLTLSRVHLSSNTDTYWWKLRPTTDPRHSLTQ